MKIKTLETIWIAEDLDIGEIICATRTFEDLIDYLYGDLYLHKDLRIHIDGGVERVENVFGKKWLKILKGFSAKKIGYLIDWDVTIRQVDLVEMIK